MDRTGQLEQRRRKRMRRLGAPNAPIETPSDAEKAARAEADLSSMSVVRTASLTAVNENASEMDELEAYMAAIKNGAPSRAARQALKQRLFELRQKEIRLMRQLGIRQPTGFRGAFCSSASSSAAMAVRTALERKQQLQKAKQESDASREGLESLAEQKRGESKLNTLKRLLPSSIKVKIGPSKEAKTGEFRPEFDEDEEEEKEEKDVPVSTNGVNEPEASGAMVSKSTATRKESALPSATAPPQPPPSPKPSESKTTTVGKAPNRTTLKTQSAPQPPPPPKPSECKATKVEGASDRTPPEAQPPSKPVVEAPVTRSTPLGPQAPPSLPLPPTVPDPAPESPQPMLEVPQVTR
ncbi:unnamed protein product [Dibothriocephalus latus]|uniref:Uncharacterized protein n=1 Tax=Dibothriocephalus latus TaxID=60516 RepID=A0A3P7NV62_DIBLA|nr:unnamed protein product [Dibothriocephalus latus]